jgi:tetratricopeptide (TPR) repeat protein
MAEITALEARAAELPGDPRTLVQLGLARARAGLGPEAERAFLAAALVTHDPALAALAYFDLGVAALEQGRLETARDAFFDALALAPGDEEARFDLEWTLRALREAPPSPPPGAGAAGKARSPAEHDAAAQPGEAPASNGPAAEEAGDEGGAEAGSARSAAGRTAGAPEGRPEESGSGARPGEAAPPGEREGARAPALAEEDAARWLGAVQDDPGRGLRDTVRRATAGERASPRTPDW